MRFKMTDSSSSNVGAATITCSVPGPMRTAHPPVPRWSDGEGASHARWNAPMRIASSAANAISISVRERARVIASRDASAICSDPFCHKPIAPMCVTVAS